MKVFVVDDSKLLRDRLVEMLAELSGIQIIGQAANSTDALQSIRKLKPDIVVLDIHMPGGNGISVIPKIKLQNPSPIIIMFTNYPYPQYREKCKKAGADYFFDKATEFETLLKLFEHISQNEKCLEENDRSIDITQ